MSVNLSPLGGAGWQFLDNSGNVLSGGLLYTYSAGTTTPLTTYQDATGTTANANPVVLDAAGRVSGEVWLTAGLNYKLVLKTSTGTTLWTADNISGGTDAAASVLAQLAASGGSSLIGFLQSGTGAVATTVQSKLRETVSVKDFGAVGNGVADDATAIQAAINAAAAQGGARVVGPKATYKLNSGITWDAALVSFDWQGSTLDFSGMTTGDALTPSVSGDVNLRPQLAGANPFMNAVLRGPGYALTSVRALYLNTADPVGFPTVAGLNFQNVSFRRFATDVYFGNGAFFTSFYRCYFAAETGLTGDTTYSIIAPSGTSNSGERNTFIECTFGARNYLVDHGNSNSDMRFIGCSFDYFDQRAVNCYGGVVYLDQCHIEASSDNSNWFYATGVNSSIVVTDSQLLLAGNKSAYDPFYSNSNVTNGGVVINGLTVISGGRTISTKLVGGTGKTITNNVSFQNADQKFALGSGANRLAYGGFESASWSGEWTVAGSTPPARSSAQAKTGTYSLLFTGVVGFTSQAYTTTPCLPGQTAVVELYWWATALTGTGGTFFVELAYLDKNGTTLTTANILAQTTTSGTWARLSNAIAAAAPAGTASARLFISVFGVTSGTPLCYVDDVIWNVS